jgi:hypothetical protein
MDTACQPLRTWDADAAVADLWDTCGLIANEALLYGVGASRMGHRNISKGSSQYSITG